MLDNHFKKEEFKESVKENVKMLYRKTGFSGGISCCKRRNY